MPDVLYEKNAEKHYAVFTLNRPDRLNAIGGRLMVELLEALDDFTNDPEMRVGILTGAGRAFCAGADMREGADRDAATKALAARRDAGEITEDEYKAEVAALAPSAPVKFDLFSPNPKPFIAAINGLAVGGGMHFVMDCDIRIASSESYLGLPEPKAGNRGELWQPVPGTDDRARGGDVLPADGGEHPHRRGASGWAGA